MQSAQVNKIIAEKKFDTFSADINMQNLNRCIFLFKQCEFCHSSLQLEFQFMTSNSLSTLKRIFAQGKWGILFKIF